MTYRYRKPLLLISILVLLLAGLPGCAANKEEVELNLAPLADMPEEVKQSPAAVQEAYRFAVANPDILKQIPCYCGCGSVGHKSNYECYVSEVLPDGSIVYDPHAFG